MLAVDAINELIEKVQEQARIEGEELSSVELKMLRWSETETGGLHSEALNGQFEAECNSEEYEDRITSLLTDAFQREAKDPKLRLRWQDIQEALKGRDYYLNVMLERAFSSIGPAQQSTLRDNLIYLGVGIGIAVIVGYIIITNVK